MKHFFIIHSNVSYLAALGVIVKIRIPLQDVIIWGIGYDPDGPVACRKIQLPEFSGAWKNLRRYFSQVAWVDEQIDRAVQGDEFMVYFPAMLDLCRIAATHRCCMGFNFIEEGISCYCSSISLWYHTKTYKSSNAEFRYKNMRTRSKDIMRILKGYTSDMDSLPFLYNAYTNTSYVRFFGFGERSFYGVNRNVFTLLSFNSIRQHFRFDSHYCLDDAVVLLGSSIVSVYGIPLDEYMRSIRKGVIEHMKTHGDIWGRPLFIKFHKDESVESKRATRMLLQENRIEYTEIDPHVILEIELINARNVILYGVESTLLFYATQMGHLAYSTVSYLPDCIDRVDDLFYREVVQLS